MQPLNDQFEFLTTLIYSDHEYIGIVANSDSSIMTFYDLTSIPTPELRSEFLQYGDIWWWESNRMLPIDIFLHHEMAPFRPYMRTFATKDVQIQSGPVTSLQNLLKKRIKRRNIQLVRRVD